MRLPSLAALALAATTIAVPRAADACGACFHGPTAGGVTESTVVTGHRMAMSISQTQTVLWDQIEYSGNPEEFAWVLPVKPGATLELAQDAWFEMLDAGTITSVFAKPVRCPADPPPIAFRGCASDEGSSSGERGDGANPNAVTVVSQDTVGPYETVTLSTEQPGALNEWLDSHGYVVPDAMQPTVDAYVEEDFDFIALRLIPGNGVNMMKPVRVVMPAGQMTLPLRMVAGGTGATTAISLFVIGEGRYETQNFPNLSVDRSKVIWSYVTESSNYRDLRAATLADSDGLGWLTGYALPGTLFYERDDPTSPWNGVITYATPDGRFVDTLSELYVSLASSGPNNGGSFQPQVTPPCVRNMREAAEAGHTVVDNCDDDGVCAPLAADETSKDEIICGDDADDLAVALTGMRLSDVWITRLDAELAREAFERDLVLQAASDQSELESRFTAPIYVGHPCDAPVTTASLWSVGSRLPDGSAGYLFGGFGLMLLWRRHRRGRGAV